MASQPIRTTARRRPLLALAAALLAAPLAAPPLFADWIVTRDGSRIETKGKWRVEGAKVVFDLPNGTMGVMRKSEVDLDASAAASAEPAAPAAAAKPQPAPKRQPVLVLTDKDIPKAQSAPSAEGSAAAPTAVVDPSAPVRPAAVEVTSWRQTSGEDGSIEIGGQIKNVGSDVAANIALQVEVIDENGKSHTAAGFLERTSLVREKDTGFRAIFPEVRQISRPPIFTLTGDAATIGADPAKKAGQPEGQSDSEPEGQPEEQQDPI